MRASITENEIPREAPDIEYLICQVALLWKRLLNVSTQHLGITGTERRALLCISCHPGLTQVAVADLLEIEPQNLMRALDKLQKSDWIEKKPDLNDRRAKCLFLTLKGKKMITQIKSLADEIRPKIINGMKDKELAAFTEHLALLRENLNKEL